MKPTKEAMAKIESKFTYRNTVCEFIKTVGRLSFYTIRMDGRDAEELLITDTDNNVLARITAVASGARGDYVDLYFIDEE